MCLHLCDIDDIIVLEYIRIKRHLFCVIRFGDGLPYYLRIADVLETDIGELFDQIAVSEFIKGLISIAAGLTDRYLRAVMEPLQYSPDHSNINGQTVFGGASAGKVRFDLNTLIADLESQAVERPACAFIRVICFGKVYILIHYWMSPSELYADRMNM